METTRTVSLTATELPTVILFQQFMMLEEVLK